MLYGLYWEWVFGINAKRVKNMLTLSQKWVDHLVHQKETAIDYHDVQITLTDGTVVRTGVFYSMLVESSAVTDESLISDIKVL